MSEHYHNIKDGFLDSKFEDHPHIMKHKNLHNCNSLFYGLPLYEISRLQKLQNQAARLITNTKKSYFKRSSLVTSRTENKVQNFNFCFQSSAWHRPRLSLAASPGSPKKN
jgi:hypothetical protein